MAAPARAVFPLIVLDCTVSFARPSAAMPPPSSPAEFPVGVSDGGEIRGDDGFAQRGAGAVVVEQGGNDDVRRSDARLERFGSVQTAGEAFCDHARKRIFTGAELASVKPQ
jgi:hypothetical protein